MKQEEKKMPGKIEITLQSGNPQDPFVYAPEGDVTSVPGKPKKHKSEAGKQIRFTCPNGALAVVFEHNPFNAAPGPLLAKATMDTQMRVLAPVTKRTVFKYTVVVVDSAGEPYAEDPELEVDPGPGGSPAQS